MEKFLYDLMYYRVYYATINDDAAQMVALIETDGISDFERRLIKALTDNTDLIYDITINQINFDEKEHTGRLSVSALDGDGCNVAESFSINPIKLY